MSERDPVVALLKELDRPVAPTADFADALRARLLAELADTNGAGPYRLARPLSRVLPNVRRRRLLAPALALGLVAVVITAVILSRPSPASAVDVIRQARKAFAASPPFEATLRVELNPDGSTSGVPKGATATVVISYGGRGRFRTEIAAVEPRFRGATSPGSYQVFDGRTVATFDSERNQLHSSPAPEGFQPLDYFSWRGGYPNWERICRAPGSKVFPDGQVAGRTARHIRCRDFRGEAWELWIDRETGLLLKVLGRVPGDDFFLNLGSGGSSKGGYQVERLKLRPSFPAGTFSTAAPRGALDYQGRLRAAAAKVPPFRAVVEQQSDRSYTEEAWWLNDETWRRRVLAGQGSLPGGAGSFAVSADGNTKNYNAGENSYSSSMVSADANPVRELLPEADSAYSTAACRVVGRERLAGREAVRRRCSGYDVWVDSSTGLLLRKQAPRYELRVRSIDYRPAFPAGTFKFVVPPGARSSEDLANDPYSKTRLVPGGRAPNWSATTLGGKAFSIEGLRGKPALLLLFSDWCPAGDPACDVFPALRQASKAAKGEVAIVWIDLQGSPDQARKIVRGNRLTFPVIVDAQGASLKAWNFQGFPYWLLLDSRGRVIEARLKPQTTAQLQQMLAKAKR